MAPPSSPQVDSPRSGVQLAGPLLDVRGLNAGYARRLVVFDASFSVAEGEIVTILGHNGAGKTTTLKAVFGLLRAASGAIEYRGREVGELSCAEKVAAGMTFIPAERFVFADLSVIENLRLGWERRSATDFDEQRGVVEGLFPILRERHEQAAGTLSGGQQRLVSLGIALMARPKLIMLDEPSLGLAPVMVQRVMDALRRLADEHRVAIVLLEQNVTQALRVADRAYVMRSGRIILEETAELLRARGQWWDLF